MNRHRKEVDKEKPNDRPVDLDQFPQANLEQSHSQTKRNHAQDVNDLRLVNTLLLRLLQLKDRKYSFSV